MALLLWRLPTTASINKALVRACCMYWGSWKQMCSHFIITFGFYQEKQKYRVLKYKDWINEALRATFIHFSIYKKEKEMTECLVMLQLQTEVSQRKASGFVWVHVYLFPCGLVEFQPHPQKSLKLMTSVSQADMYSIAKWILQVHK